MKQELKKIIKQIYDNKFDELDPHIECIVKLNDCSIEQTFKEIEKIINVMFVRNDKKQYKITIKNDK